MATKVDRTASMLCRRSGCSSEKLAERVIELEAALRRLIDGVPGDHPRRDDAPWVLLGPDEPSSGRSLTEPTGKDGQP